MYPFSRSKWLLSAPYLPPRFFCIGLPHKLHEDLKNTAEISELCHRSEEPVYITKNGYGDMVIMSIENYERAMKKLRMYQALETSERQIKEGSVKDARESLSAMRGKYGL